MRGIVEVKPGTWLSTIRSSDEKHMGRRTAELLVFHDATDSATLTWREASFIVGVDSGTAGVFDQTRYRDDSVLPAEIKAKAVKPDMEKGEAWYQTYVVEKRGSAIVVPSGVVFRSHAAPPPNHRTLAHRTPTAVDLNPGTALSRWAVR